MQNQQNKSEIILFKTTDEKISVNVLMENESVWLTQEQMAQLFDKDRSVITKHIGNIFKEGELEEKLVCAFFAHTTKHGAIKGKTQEKKVKYYNLDVIISVGYRVKSFRGTEFRKWATQILREYIIKGFAMDDERLKGAGGGNYWKELLDRIRDIRSSEKALYRQVLDLYATSSDYDAKNLQTKIFFATVQNKLHYAVNKQTSAEIIFSRVDAEKEFMGLSTFTGEIPQKKDITVAKNYLTEIEIKKLNNMVSAFFDLAELKALEHTEMKMKDYLQELDTFTNLYGKGVLEDAGKISYKQAVQKAEKEYKKYQVKTLTNIEKKYLESLKQIEKDISKK